MISRCCFVGLLFTVFILSDSSVSSSIRKRDIIIASPFSSEPKQKCIKQLLDWCKLNQNSTHQMERAAVLVEYYDMLALSKVYCFMDSEGTECIRYNRPWFHCYPNGTVIYKGTILAYSNSTVDDNICETKDTAEKLANQLGFNKTAYETGMRKYIEDVIDIRKQVRLLKNMMHDVQNRLFSISPFVFDVNAEIEDNVSVNSTSKIAPLQNCTKISPPKNSTEITPQKNSTKTTITPQKNSTKTTITPQKNSTVATPHNNSTEVTPQKNSTEITPHKNATEITPQKNSTEITPRKNATEITPQKNATEVTP